MDEARVLWEREVTTLDDMEACARDLSARFGTAVLVKGGHLQGRGRRRALPSKRTLSWHTAPRTAGVHTHGTGCTFSAAIATGLAHGMPLKDAVAQAKQFVSRAIAQHFTWQSAGAGHRTCSQSSPAVRRMRRPRHHHPDLHLRRVRRQPRSRRTSARRASRPRFAFCRRSTSAAATSPLTC
jgi:pyridoxal/pyridoxine/pyridoxamine kinase